MPPKPSNFPAAAVLSVVLLVAAALVSGLVLFFFNPETHSLYPPCLFHRLTGLNCPGCGSTRAAYHLLHGDLPTALHDNALFVATLLALVFWIGRVAIRRMRKQPCALTVSPRILWVYLILAVGFAIFRNLPAFSFLSP